MADADSPIMTFLNAALKVKKSFDDQANASYKNMYTKALAEQAIKKTEQLGKVSPNVAAQLSSAEKLQAARDQQAMLRLQEQNRGALERAQILGGRGRTGGTKDDIGARITGAYKDLGGTVNTGAAAWGAPRPISQGLIGGPSTGGAARSFAPTMTEDFSEPIDIGGINAEFGDPEEESNPNLIEEELVSENAQGGLVQRFAFGGMPSRITRVVPRYNRGGLVQQFVEGGAPVEDPSATPVGDVAENVPLPRPAPRAREVSTQEPGPKKEENSYGFNYKDTIKNWYGAGLQQSNHPEYESGNMSAPALALQGVQEELQKPGQTATASPGERLAKGEGAADPKEMQMLMKAVDPDNELTEKARYIAAMDIVTKSYVNAGNIDTAKKVAASALLYGQQMSQKLGALAAAALEKNDQKTAAVLIGRSHNFVPDGQELKVTPVEGGGFRAALHDDANGVVKDLGVISAKDAFAFTQKLMGGADFIPTVAGSLNRGSRTAGATGTQQGGRNAPVGTEGARNPSLSDRAKASEQLDEVLPQDVKEGEAPVRPGLTQGILKPLLPEVKNIAAGVLHANNITAGKAVDVVEALMDTSKEKPEYKIHTKEGGGDATVVLRNGEQYTLPRNTFLQAMAARGKAKELVRVERERKDKEAKEPGMLSGATPIAKKLISGRPAASIGRLAAAGARNVLPEMPDVVPAAQGLAPEDNEALSTIRRMIGGAGRVVGRVQDYLGPPEQRGQY